MGAIIGGYDIYQLLEGYRLCWISGRFGGGKTSLAFSLAEYYLKKGYRLITNSRCVWADKREDVKLNDQGHLKAVVVLDEGGLYFKATRQVEMVASYARKMDVIYLIPSFWPPVRSAHVVIIQPLWSLVSAGVPAIVYRWRVRLGAFEDKGHAIWINPQDIYGTYSTQDPGEEQTEIVDWLIQRTHEYQQFHGHDTTNHLSEVASAEDRLEDAANTFADAVESIPVPKRGRGRRGF